MKNEGMAEGQMRLPVYVMQSGAIDLTNSKDALALELLACNTPYESMEELCRRAKDTNRARRTDTDELTPKSSWGTFFGSTRRAL